MTEMHYIIIKLCSYIVHEVEIVTETNYIFNLSFDLLSIFPVVFVILYLE